MSVDDERPEHWVNQEPFNPYSTEVLTPEQERFYLASQWQLMWWKLARHPLAVVSGAFLLLLYLSIVFSEIIAPHGLHKLNARFIYAPPQTLHLFHDGDFVGPFVYGYKMTRDLKRMKRIYTPDPSKIYEIGLFCQGDKYHFWGLWKPLAVARIR